VEKKQLTIIAPVESTEQWLVDFLSLFIERSYPTLLLTYRLLTEHRSTCIALLYDIRNASVRRTHRKRSNKTFRENRENRRPRLKK